MPFSPTRPRRRTTGAAVGTLVVGLALGAAAPTAGAAPRPTTAPTASTAASAASAAAPDRKPVPASVVPELRWEPCGKGLEAFQCATAQVPLDYDQPRGGTIRLALTRLPASDPGRRIGTLFTNPGGPGGSGVDFVQSGAPALYPAEVRARFDILGFDPRGVARSTPATCFATQEDETAYLGSTLAFPITAAQERRYDREAKALARSCAATSKVRFQHISTANVARDMDLLRRAVGDAKLSYAGYSYGTFLGATYTKLFPRKVRALVLDGTLDPREYSGTAPRYRNVPVGSRIEQDRGGDEVFEEFLRRCRAAGAERCSLAALGDPGVVARQTLDALKKRPVTLTLPDGTAVQVNYQAAVAATFSGLYSATMWSDVADLLTVLAAGTGTGAAVPAAPAAVAALIRTAQEEDYASIGGSIGSTCVDARTPARSVFPAAADRADRRFPDFGRYRAWVGYQCSYFEAEGLRDTDAYTGPWQQTTSARVMVLGTRWDPATPYKNIRPYADLFRRASVTTLAGWGQTTLGQSRCVDQRVAAYLLRPATKRANATCATQVMPFAAASTSGARVEAREAAAAEAQQLR